MEALESLVDFVPRAGQDGTYQTIDVYTVGTAALYTLQPGPIKPIGSAGSGFKLGAPGNIRLNLGFGLQERYDLSGHNGLGPHINYDILGTNINLGPAHKIDLDI